MIDLTGKVFGRLTVVAECERNDVRHRRWECRCECGVAVKVRHGNLNCGKAKSCGCLQREKAATQAIRMGKANATHGRSGTPEHNAWHAMWQRCTNPNGKVYRHYGGRGIGVCERWKAFENFFADMGPRPSAAHSLDRIDVNRGYEPGNCRWADQKTQQRNRRNHRLVSFRGETKCVGEWAEVFGLTVAQLFSRLFIHGWEVERAMTTPPRVRKALITA